MDLLRWARGHRGSSWAARARTALRAGAALRLAVRRLALPFVAKAKRLAWREEDGRLREVVQRVEAGRGGLPSEASPPGPLSLTGEGGHLLEGVAGAATFPGQTVVDRSPSPVRERGPGGEASEGRPVPDPPAD
jgi:hypothetical protein